ncbi:helix-turn-helix transcriptional regulator [Geoalkalibacter halelectricus]|uniref:AlpA family phage regulatory protein n=1 Tax=Geoalkalibacter halelectricus TaxID=2847045 RepID=A0ABY5ZH41_9BACT|nr:AlpA family phage regulatory protein [Geoalkalibacter halelectricus]MDO3376556.1 AlpA family phage regulatory protein [Geoalkalibacter halelectricus]UWZ78480.1 AlpA family phage regulatory protein [Geoalkalibacter halelectricus]
MNLSRNTLPETGYLRLSQILGSPKADPPIPPLIPISKSTWWAGVKEKRFPAPVKLGPRTTVWRVEDILALIEGTYEPPAGSDHSACQ